jgi:hypothetical protein
MARMTSVVRALFTLIISMIDRLVGVNRKHGNACQKNRQQHQRYYFLLCLHLKSQKYMQVFELQNWL